ncbi:nad-binding rossmann fold oxidoreductase family protein [Teratosphaeria destructans]|uniref:Nad-binding rossmann fold oxidoreductase family protein n=1 Tax=Teratosphaeria destructans TaxID=418781 RepID=A0A9W7SM32_9PEZI|nr:nad-binding rossmann fold oxidoreductase family protein [Teratosphaeria destructans]
MSKQSLEPKRLAIGVVGLGRIGKVHARNALHYVHRTKLICACSVVEAEIEWAQHHLVPYGVAIYRTFEEMLQHPGLEALLIASTTKVHCEQVVAGIQKGLHVLCEKPLAMNLNETREVYALATRPEYRHLKVMTAFSRRFDRSYQNARRAIQEGRIGTPVVVRCDNRDKYDRSEAYMRYIMLNPGIFIDTEIHDVDLTLSFLGPNARPKSCYSVGTIALHKELAQINDVDNAVGTVEWYPTTPGGVAPISYYHVSRIAHHGFDNPTEITGTEGQLKINLHPRRDLITVADKNGIGNDVMPDFFERYEPAFVTELEVFADSVLDNTPLPYELDEAVKGMEVAEALQESLRTGKKIEWDVQGRRLDKEPKSHI